MRVWTIQPQKVYDQLRLDGVVHVDFSLSPYGKWEEFRRSYGWMIEQMKSQIGLPPTGVTYPYWAWHTLGWEHKRPDLRRIEFRNCSDLTVCIELELPESQVLLSDDEKWHYVLNDWYLGDATSIAEFEAEDKWLESLSEKELRTQKLKSWNKVFNVDPVHDEWQGQGRDVQATFWELRLSDVIAVRHFQWPSLKK